MSHSEQTVAVRIPLRVWGRLASAAEARHLDVAEVLVQAAAEVINRVTPTPKPAARHRPVKFTRAAPEKVERLKELLRTGGLSHAEIAMVTGCSEATVYKWARLLREERRRG